jgi:anti-sigma factor RsiW
MDDYDDIHDLDLHAYIDDLLDPPRRRAVEAYLALHPDRAEWVRRCRLQNDAMRAVFGPVAEEALPSQLSAVFRPRHPSRFPGLVSRMAPLAATLLLGCGLGWSAGEFLPRGEASTQVLRESASLAHTDVRKAAVAGHLALSEPVLRPIKWIEQASMVDLQIPDLSRYRFSLVGSQVTATTNRSQAAQISYQDDQGRRLTLQVQPRLPDPDPEIEIEKRNDVRVAYWLDGPLMYVMASDLPREETLEVAESLYRSIRKMPPPEPESAFGIAKRLKSLLWTRG